jgi:hypothetical protein
MKVLAAVGVLVISVIVIALQLSGWSQAEPRTVNLSSTTRSVDGPVVDSSGVTPNLPATTANASLQPTAGSRFIADVRQESEFIWPARGPLTSYFGAYHLLGIDIGLDNSEDSPIVASAGGVVEFAGGAACCEYGLHVIVNHEGGRSTLYAHLSRLDVSTGDEVQQGQQLGLGGTTGVSDGKHLHFELHEGDTVVDPLRYLPASERTSQLPYFKNDCTSGYLRIDPDSKIWLEFTDAAGFRPISARFDDDATAAGFSAGIEGIGGITRRISAEVPAASSAKGLVRDANLTVTLSDGTSQVTIDCNMRLATMVTMANAPRVTKHPGSSAVPGTPTATPIRSKYPTPTPPVKAAPATPARPATTAGGVVSTPRPATTPQPVATTKPIATVKPPQQFPIQR